MGADPPVGHAGEPTDVPSETDAEDTTKPELIEIDDDDDDELLKEKTTIRRKSRLIDDIDYCDPKLTLPIKAVEVRIEYPS